MTFHLRQVHCRAVRAAASGCDDRQQPAADSALQSRGELDHADQDPRRHSMEFTTLPGVVEDTTDVVLNVKSLVVRTQRFDARHPH